MDVSTIGNLSSALAQGQTGDAVGIQVLKKAMQIEAQNASQLIEAAAQSAPTNNPPNLGNNVDVKV